VDADSCEGPGVCSGFLHKGLRRSSYSSASMGQGANDLPVPLPGSPSGTRQACIPPVLVSLPHGKYRVLSVNHLPPPFVVRSGKEQVPGVNIQGVSLPDAFLEALVHFWGVQYRAPMAVAYIVPLTVLRYILIGLFMAILVKRLSRR